MFGRSPDQRRKTSGLYGYPRDLTQELARMRVLKANATANPAEPDLAGFGSFEYVELEPTSGAGALRYNGISEFTLANTIKSFTMDNNVSDRDDATPSSRSQMLNALAGLSSIAKQHKAAAGGAPTTNFDQAISYFAQSYAKLVEVEAELRPLVSTIKALSSSSPSTVESMVNWLTDDVLGGASSSAMMFTSAVTSAFSKIADKWVSAKTKARQALIYYVAARTKAAPPSISYKDWTVDQIKAVQRALARIGYYTKAIDGVIGAGTTAALDRLMAAWKTSTPAQVQHAANALPEAREEGGGSGVKPEPTSPLIIPKDYSGSSNKGLIIGLIAAGAVAVVGAALYLKRRGRGRTTTVTYQPALSGFRRGY